MLRISDEFSSFTSGKLLEFTTYTTSLVV